MQTCCCGEPALSSTKDQDCWLQIPLIVLSCNSPFLPILPPWMAPVIYAVRPVASDRLFMALQLMHSSKESERLPFVVVLSVMKYSD